MKTLLQNLGAILVLVGVCFLATYFFATRPENWMLVTGLAFQVVGFFSYIIINKRIQ